MRTVMWTAATWPFSLPTSAGLIARSLLTDAYSMKTTIKKSTPIICAVSLMVVSLLSAAIAGEPTIEFTSVPKRCTFDNLHGAVENVDPADYEVIVYIFIPHDPFAAGWWVKPSLASPRRPIQKDGTWTCDITTGGIDETATWIIAFLIHKDDNPELPLHTYVLPEELCNKPYALVKRNMSRIIPFSGYDWGVKSMCGRELLLEPGGNYFSDTEENVWIDTERELHLKLTFRDEKWYCAEVSTLESFGYGKYIFRLKSRVDLVDKNVVLGLFTWDDKRCEDDNREIDIEFSKWGEETDLNAQFVVRPWYQPGHRHRFPIILKDDYSTHFLNWGPDKIDFQNLYGHPDLPSEPGDIIESWTYTGDDIPLPGKGNARMNLWLVNGQPPSDGQEVEVVITSFEFIPCCEGDFDGDGDVDGSDLAIFAVDFGRTDCGSGATCEGDFDNDDDVDGSDLAIFAADFGRTDCPQP